MGTFLRLLEARASSKYPTKQHFWPEGSLQSIIGRNDIITDLNLTNADHELVDFILGDAIKLLATCLMSQIPPSTLEQMMRTFQDCDFTDRNIPVEEDVFSSYAFAESLPWSVAQRHNFLQYQWQFAAQTFFRANFWYLQDSLLPEETILPFIDDLPLAKGYFGTVHKVTVHPWHFDDDDPVYQDNWQVAIKEVELTGKNHASLKALRDSLAEREKEALLFLKEEYSDRVKHIIDVKAIFDRGNRRYYMFPWANGGDLWDLLEDSDHLQTQEEGQFVADVFTQIFGLAEALSVLHRNNCRHGDLKPENILIFKSQDQPDMWKIADLGLARIHYKTTAGRSGPTSTRHGSVSYEPPEFLLDIRDEIPTSRLYDMWSMGCIILQLITWLCYDIQEVKMLIQKTRNTLQNESTFWIQRWTGVSWGPQIVHEEVSNHIEMLIGDPYVSQAIKDLLQVVRDQLLVVQLPDNFDDEWRPGYRANAHTLCKELERISRRGEEDHGYWSTCGTFLSNQLGAASSATEPFGRGYDDVSL